MTEFNSALDLARLIEQWAREFKSEIPVPVFVCNPADREKLDKALAYTMWPWPEPHIVEQKFIDVGEIIFFTTAAKFVPDA